MIKPPPVTGPGLYDMEAAEYHADPCPEPSLNHTVAKILERKSPRHAWLAHPRLGGASRTASRVMNIGNAVHELAIGKGRGIDCITFPDFRTKAAQEARDASIAAGRTPLIQADYDLAQTMWPHMRAAIEDVAGAKIDTLLRETVAVAKDGEFWLRSMIDVMTPDCRLIIDAKTALSAEPETFAKKIRSDYATQDAFIRRVLDGVDPEGVGRRRFVFIAQERDCPEAITLHELDFTALNFADAAMKKARLTWAMCQSANHWPTYERGPHYVAPAPWEIDAEMDAEEAGIA